MNTENPYESPREPKEAPRPEATEVAQMVLGNMQRAFQPKHLYQVVDGRDFRHVSRRFYRRTQARLEDLGFSFVGDVEDVTMKVQTPDPRTFIRTMVSRDRTDVAAFYHVRPVLLWRLGMLLLRIPAKIVEFESYTTSGRAYCTSTAPRFVHAPHPDSIRRDSASRKLSVADLYDRHMRNLAERAGSGELIPVSTVEDVIDFQNLMETQLHEHLQRIGWVTKEYLLAQGVRKGIVDEVYDEAQRLLGRTEKSW